VQDLDGERWSDSRHLAHALAFERVPVTQDTDFLVLAAEAQRTGRPFATVVFCPQGTPLGTFVTDLELIARSEPESACAGRVIFLPL
jgi:hypothetical protein